MARIPILQDPSQLQTGNRTLRTPDLPAVTNAGIAKGLADVGAVAMDISEKAKRANDVTNLTNASIEMQKAQLEFATFQQETPDETKWLPKWKEINSRLEGQFSQMPMTPDARAQLQNRLTTWSTNGTIQVQASAFKQTGQRMMDASELAKMQAIKTKNPSAYKDSLNDRVAAGFLTPEAAAVEYAVVEDAIKTKDAEDLRNQIPELIRMGNQGDANAWIQLKEVNDKLKELGVLDAKNYEIAQKQAEMGESKSLIESRIYGYNGMAVDLKRADELIDLQKDDLTPEIQMQLRADIVKAKKAYLNQDLLNFANRMARGEAIDGNSFFSQYADDAELQDIRAKINESVPVDPTVQAKLYFEMLNDIDNFNPATAKDQDPQELVRLANKAAVVLPKLPPQLRSILSESLDAKMSGREAKGIVAEGEKKARSMLLEIVKKKENSFFSGYGQDRKIIEGKEAEWAAFQQKLFNLETKASERIKDVKDTKQLNEILMDVMGEDYISAKKQKYMPEPESGFDKKPGPWKGDSSLNLPSGENLPFPFTSLLPRP